MVYTLGLQLAVRFRIDLFVSPIILSDLTTQFGIVENDPNY